MTHRGHGNFSDLSLLPWKTGPVAASAHWSLEEAPRSPPGPEARPAPPATPSSLGAHCRWGTVRVPAMAPALASGDLVGSSSPEPQPPGDGPGDTEPHTNTQSWSPYHTERLIVPPPLCAPRAPTRHLTAVITHLPWAVGAPPDGHPGPGSSHTAGTAGATLSPPGGGGKARWALRPPPVPQAGTGPLPWRVDRHARQPCSGPGSPGLHAVGGHSVRARHV